MASNLFFFFQMESPNVHKANIAPSLYILLQYDVWRLTEQAKLNSLGRPVTVEVRQVKGLVYHRRQTFIKRVM